MRVPTSNMFQRQSLALSTQFNNVFKLQQQLYTGKKMINSSDDPVLASQVKAKQDYLTQLNSYNNNGAIAQGRGAQFSTSIQSCINSMSDIQALLIKAQNGTTSPADRVAYANTLQSDLTNLLNMANMQDTNGEYIYSGSNTGTAPYIKSGSSYQYQGSYAQVNIDVGPSTSTVFREVGYNVFGNSYLGNGTFTVAANSGNTGTAYSTPGSVTNPTAYVSDTYTITFSQSGNPPQTYYQVTGASSGVVVPSTLYNPDSQKGQDISFNGLTININGPAAAGDTFTIAPSTQQNVFDTVQNLINELKNGSANNGIDKTILSQASASLSQIMNNFTSYQSTVGSRNANLNTEVQANKDLVTQQTIVLSSLQDADFPAVVSLYSQQTMALQATQESYLKLQSLISQLLQL